MAYDKKLLAAARRELERERAARADELEERKRAVYAREPRIRAIDRELSATAASVLRAALESGGDPAAAIEQLRERNLSLQAERASLLGQLGLPGDYLTDKPLCPKCGDTAMTAARPARVCASGMRACSRSSSPPSCPSRTRTSAAST